MSETSTDFIAVIERRAPVIGSAIVRYGLAVVVGWIGAIWTLGESLTAGRGRSASTPRVR